MMTTGWNEDDFKRNVTDRETWLHFVYLVVCGIAFYLASMLVFAIAVVQFLARLFSGAPFARLTRFGADLAEYQAQLTRYLTFAGIERPFPFGPFPGQPAADTVPPVVP